MQIKLIDASISCREDDVARSALLSRCRELDGPVTLSITRAAFVTWVKRAACLTFDKSLAALKVRLLSGLSAQARGQQAVQVGSAYLRYYLFGPKHV